MAHVAAATAQVAPTAGAEPAQALQTEAISDDVTLEELSRRSQCMTPLGDIIARAMGPFRFTPKQITQKSGGKYGGWEVACPFHRKNRTSGCRKWFGLCGPTLRDKQECVAAALEWCAAARQFSRQWQHIAYQVDYKAAAPVEVTRKNSIFSEKPPAKRCTPDSELDGQQSAKMPTEIGAAAHTMAAPQQPAKKKRKVVMSVRGLLSAV